MKKLFLLLFIFQVSVLGVSAQAYQMRAAIEKAIFNNKLLTSNSYSNSGFDESDNGEELCRWSVLKYEFSVKQSDATVFEPVMKAFEKDRADKRTTSFIKTEADKQMHSFQFSSCHPPITIGSLDQARAQVVVVGDERPDVNTVIAMEVWPNGDIINGNIFIIERDPSFRAVPFPGSEKANTASDGKPTDFISIGLGMINDAINKSSENLRRLAFYAQKYEIDAEIGTASSAIVKATVLVVSDIILKGTNDEKLMAKQIIDHMIMATPDPTRAPISNERKAAYEDNAKTLLNLLSRLDSKDDYSADLKPTPNTFRINGIIDPDLWDIGYYISKSDENMGSPTLDTEFIKAEGKTFHFQTELNEIRLGRVRALMKDGTVCSAWIDLLFVPGEIAELHVHNGNYSLSGTGFYNDWNAAHNAFAWANGPSSLRGDKRDKAFLDILREHTDKPAYFIYAFKEKVIRLKETRQKAYDLLPEKIKLSQYGVFLRKYL